MKTLDARALRILTVLFGSLAAVGLVGIFATFTLNTAHFAPIAWLSIGALFLVMAMIRKLTEEVLFASLATTSGMFLCLSYALVSLNNQELNYSSDIYSSCAAVLLGFLCLLLIVRAVFPRSFQSWENFVRFLVDSISSGSTE